ncbi:MAG TPA: acyl-CoA dehydrogenase [Cycloclasticus sp.]|jgi:acyl-CoA dehydrogenase|nr:acyl-CoA dehydrogenase [Cycloclasticus sp.]HIL92295.1 acyl-CoA dehydrogenase [Cycloclasticus sp.]
MNELSHLIEESAAKLFEGFALSNGAEEMEAGVFPEALWQAFINDGWLQTMLAEEKGGAGLGLAGGCVLMRLAGYYAVPLPVVESLMAVYLLAESGQAVADELYIPVIVKAGLTDAEQFELAGVPWARYAAGMVLVLPTDNGCSICIVKQQDMQLTNGANMAGEPRDDVRIKIQLLRDAKPVDGVSVERIKSWLALGRAAQLSGALQRTLEMTVNYATERKQFGREIAKFQAVQQQVAVQAEHTSAARCAVDASMAHLGSEQEWECIAAAKITAGEAAGISAKTAHAVHAAIGFTQEYSLQLSTRRLWSWRDEYGNEAEWSIQLGEYFMQLAGDDIWHQLTKQTA